jgi:hypothetical protein
MNNRGFGVIGVLVAIIIGGALLFVSNPVSNFIGVGVRPNKTVHTETLEPVKDQAGNVVAYKRIVNETDQQQHITVWEWLRSLPIMVLLLMGSGIASPVVSLFLHNVWSRSVATYNDLTGETRRIVVSVKAGLDTIKDQAIRDTFLLAMSGKQDQSTKDLVKELLKVESKP